VVRDIRVRRDLPHRLVIEVVERVPVGAVSAGGRRIAVAADGTVLTGTPAPGPLAAIPGAPPGGPRVSDPRTVRAVDLLAAAPAPLRARVERVAEGRRGLVAWLRDGPLLIFGSSDLLATKWEAAAVVLADPRSAGATYVDLRSPDRPAAGGVGDPQEGAEEEQALAGTPPADEVAAPSANPPAATAPQPTTTAPPPDAQP
jgi:cell division protein FtsQ